MTEETPRDLDLAPELHAALDKLTPEDIHSAVIWIARHGMRERGQFLTMLTMGDNLTAVVGIAHMADSLRPLIELLDQGTKSAKHDMGSIEAGDLVQRDGGGEQR